MVVENRGSILLAFPGGRDTENCIKEAERIGLIILRVV
jgi:hypothetical protein